MLIFILNSQSTEILFNSKITDELIHKHRLEMLSFVRLFVSSLQPHQIKTQTFLFWNDNNEYLKDEEEDKNDDDDDDNQCDKLHFTTELKESIH